MSDIDPLLRELVVETPWNMRVLEDAIERARLADMSDDEIRKLLEVGGPDLIHSYVAAMQPHMLYDCWCGESHWKTPIGSEAFRNFGHLVIESLRIPQLADWLERRFRRTR
jgi:hypothetical protein